MKFDNVIIGGGLAGLVCGIRLQEKGHNCVIISTGQSALHFSSGSFDLLSNLPDGTVVTNPLEAIDRLEKPHPYALIGSQDIAKYAVEFADMMARAGIHLKGDAACNHYHFTPMGSLKSTWLTLDEFVTFNESSQLPWKKALIINFPGFLDFYTKFIADEFEQRQVSCQVTAVKLPFLEKIRENPTEMRSANIAKAFDKPENVQALVDAIAPMCKDVDVLVVPAVFGLKSDEPLHQLKKALGDKALCSIATMPPSVPGIRMQQQLTHYFQQLGGTFMLGDTVNRAELEGGEVKAVFTVNHGDIPICGDKYILATGSFFSRGIIARPDSVYEPIFDLDVFYDPDRSKWYDSNMFAPQNYMKFGVQTDEAFHALYKKEPLSNLYAIGSVLAGHNALHEGCGGGVAAMSAFHVAENI